MANNMFEQYASKREAEQKQIEQTVVQSDAAVNELRTTLSLFAESV